jgi:hypothetical protein
MDPTIEVLTIHPAAWAALFQGLAEGIAYGLAIGATLIVAAVALVSWRGRPVPVEDALDALGLGEASAQPAVQPLWIPAQPHTTRRRPRHGRRRVA